ncbi:MAG: thioesterase family protein [Kofleriaceae bacterium]|nr:thioesterase family protein [Kofleriaceae bacterium]
MRFLLKSGLVYGVQFDKSMRERWVSHEGTWSFELPSGWGQGRTIYGGVSTAAAVALGYRITALQDRHLRSLQAQFFRPVRPGTLIGKASILRSGGSTTFVRIDLWQDDIVMSVNIVLAKARAESTTLLSEERWQGPPADSLTDLPFIPGVIPEFIQNLSMRWVSGDAPFSGASTAKFSGYCRFRAGSSDVEGVVAILDAWPCPSLAAGPPLFPRAQ